MTPTIVVVGGIAVWLFVTSTSEVLEETQELVEIAAATAPPIVPATSEASTVPPPTQPSTSLEADAASPAYIPPADVTHRHDPIRASCRPPTS